MQNWISKEAIGELVENRELTLLKKMGGLPGILRNLHTSERGLTSNFLQSDTRIQIYGKNEFDKPKTKGFLRLWLEAFNDTTLMILLALAVISLIIALAVEHGKELSWLDGTAILVTVIIVTLVSAFNTWSQERQFQKLNERQKDRNILVTRDGKPTQISVFDLLVGDIFTIQTGDVLPADGLCLESNNVSCDEAPMTGESDLIRKSPDKMPFMLCGCKVQTGFGKMIVIAVGMNTEFGKLKQAVITSAQERQLTPLQEKLDDLAKKIGYVGFIAAGFTLLLLIIFWVIPGAKNPSRFKTGQYWILLVDYFIIAVTIIVMAVPEGLPLAVTIALAYSMKKMLVDNNLVRVLSSCETMGGATTICSDKTGTLTQNKMKVTAGFFNGTLMDAIQKGVQNNPSPYGQRDPRLSIDYLALLTESLSLNSSADLKVQPNDSAFGGLTRANTYAVRGGQRSRSLTQGMAPEIEMEKVEYLGNVTECALLLFAREQGVDYNWMRQEHHIVQTFPFSSDKKRMTVIVERGNVQYNGAGTYDQSLYRIYTKGASETICSICNKMLVGGQVISIDDSARDVLNNVIMQMASRGLRTIGIAYRDIQKSDAKSFKLKNSMSLINKQNIPKKIDQSAEKVHEKEWVENDMIDNKTKFKQNQQNLNLMKQNNTEQTNSISNIKSSLPKIQQLKQQQNSQNTNVQVESQYDNAIQQQNRQSNPNLNVQTGQKQENEFNQYANQQRIDTLGQQQQGRQLDQDLSDQRVGQENNVGGNAWDETKGNLEDAFHSSRSVIADPKSNKVSDNSGDENIEDPTNVYGIVQGSQGQNVENVNYENNGQQGLMPDIGIVQDQPPEIHDTHLDGIEPVNGPESDSNKKQESKSNQVEQDYDGPFSPDDPPEEDLILIGITGIKDPLRPEVNLAINDCHDAHIVVRMVTGDNIVTAMHIAEECGIYNPKFGVAMEGPVFRALSEQDRLRVLPKLQVLARSSPIDKHLLVSGLQELGHVVAVTGDGTNDAPALSKADVGFAMGITGTEVAKDAAAIIITDDNFASIVKAVMWGRNVYDSIRKFIQFQLTVNIAAIVIAVIGAIFAITPLRAVQMLWVNLIMDTLAALALATEGPTKSLLKRKPYGRTDNIISGTMWRNTISGAVYQVVILIVMMFLWGHSAPFTDPADIEKGCSLLQPKDEIICSELLFPNGLCRKFLLDQNVPVFSEQHFSLIFNSFIFMQIFNWIPSRRCYNELNFFDRILDNYMFLTIWVLVAVLQIIIMLVPGIRDAFSVIPISAQLWAVTIAFSICIIPYRFLISLCLKMPDPFHGEVEIKGDPGVPAGVYTLGGKPPQGCEITLPDKNKSDLVTKEQGEIQKKGITSLTRRGSQRNLSNDDALVDSSRGSVSQDTPLSTSQIEGLETATDSVRQQKLPWKSKLQRSIGQQSSYHMEKKSQPQKIKRSDTFQAPSRIVAGSALASIGHETNEIAAQAAKAMARYNSTDDDSIQKTKSTTIDDGYGGIHVELVSDQRFAVHRQLEQNSSTTSLRKPINFGKKQVVEGFFNAQERS